MSGAYHLAYFAAISALFGAIRFWKAVDQVRDAVKTARIHAWEVDGIRAEFKDADRKVAWGIGLTVLSMLLVTGAIVLRFVQ